jgi:pyruvate/2-oxoglutarate dehydrogenase complex dihydrolipoamide acyltransferase (E2) component
MAKMTLKVPKAAVSMQEGTIVKWLVAEGADVALGQTIYELETEKTTMEVESPFAGVIKLIGVPGTTYKVGEPIAEIHTAAPAPQN